MNTILSHLNLRTGDFKAATSSRLPAKVREGRRNEQLTGSGEFQLADVRISFREKVE
jgi:hypothetical protein